MKYEKYYQNEPRFNGVYFRDNLPERSSTECSSVEIKDEAYIINLDEYSDIRTHWIVLYLQSNDVTYFDSFGVEHIPKKIYQKQRHKTNIFRIQAYDSTMCGYFCIGFIGFMLAGKTLTEFTNLFSRHNLKKKIMI